MSDTDSETASRRKRTDAMLDVARFDPSFSAVIAVLGLLAAGLEQGRSRIRRSCYRIHIVRQSRGRRYHILNTFVTVYLTLGIRFAPLRSRLPAPVNGTTSANRAVPKLVPYTSSRPGFCSAINMTVLKWFRSGEALNEYEMTHLRSEGAEEFATVLRDMFDEDPSKLRVREIQFLVDQGTITRDEYQETLREIFDPEGWGGIDPRH